MISIDGTSSTSFALKSLDNACVLVSQTGLVAESCTIQYKGVTTSGGTVSALCTFEADLLAPKLALCTLPSSFTGLKSVSIVPVTATLPPATMVMVIDNVYGTTNPK